MSFERIKARAADPAALDGQGRRSSSSTTSEVQGLAPPIPIFRPGELTTGPVPYGAPTHWDMMTHVTPEAFKAGTVPVSSLALMGLAKLIQWEQQRAREERREKERQAAIEAERERQKRLKESIVLSPPK